MARRTIPALLLLLLARAPGGEAALSEPATTDALTKIAWESVSATAQQRPPQQAEPQPALAARRDGAWIGVLRQGKLLGQGESRSGALPVNLRIAGAAAAAKMEPADLKEAVLLITVFGPERPADKAPLPSELRNSAHLGLDGFRAEYRGLEAFLPPLSPLLAGWSAEDSFKELARRLAPPAEEKDPAAHEETTRLLRILTDPSFRYSFVPGTSWARLPDGKPLRLFRLFPKAIPPAEATRDELEAALIRAGHWFSVRAGEKRWSAVYDARTGEASSEADLGSRLRAATALAALGARQEQARLRTAGEAVLDSAMESYVEDPQTRSGMLKDGDAVRLDAASAALEAIAIFSPETRKPVWREKAGALAAFVRAMRRPDGSFASALPAEEPRPEDLAAGLDAAAALLAWAAATGTQVADTWVRDGSDLQRKLFETDPRLDAVPALTRLASRLRAPPQPALESAVLQANRLLAATQPQAGLPADCLGRFVPRQGRTNAAADLAFCARAVRSLCAAFPLARDRKEADAAAALRAAALLGARYLLQLQVKDELDALAMPEPDRALGGFRAAPDDLRMPLGGNAESVLALLAVLEVFSPADFAAVGAGR